ncbi:TRAP transporter small permease [Desulfohalovibrio reitneri]|uniref:TRAP transporter small permease n=1 Tax=Desulfohalovibrio reitneri TaxID=1307759 RepID=UPI000A8146DC|nr:TRAP transporter small permease [Desulfohalovibrio reitneri]
MAGARQNSDAPGALERLTRAMRGLAAACLAGMAVVTGVDVVGRGLFNAPLYGSEEIVSILAVAVVGLSLPYAHRKGSHIGVEVVYRRLPRGARLGLTAATSLAACVFFAVVAWRMALYGAAMQRVGTLTMNLGLPVHLVQYGLAACFAVFSLALGRTGLLALGGKREREAAD